MKRSFWRSKIAILFTALTAVPAYSQRLEERVPPKRPLEWSYRWALKAPEVSLQNQNGELILSGTNILRKARVARDLENWMGRNASNFNQVDWKNDINLTPLLSEKFKQLNIGGSVPANGLNCHGASLYVNGLINHLSHVGYEEFNFYIHNFCKEVTEPQVGAIGALFFGNNADVFYHSYTILGSHLIFEKKSIEKNDPFRFRLTHDFGSSRFFKCHAVSDVCVKYQELKNEIDQLDRIYSYILITGDRENFREKAIHQIQPLLDRVEHELNQARETDCRLSLQKAKYRLVSLESVAKNILGAELYKAGVGRLIQPIQPKL